MALSAQKPWALTSLCLQGRGAQGSLMQQYFRARQMLQIKQRRSIKHPCAKHSITSWALSEGELLLLCPQALGSSPIPQHQLFPPHHLCLPLTGPLHLLSLSQQTPLSPPCDISHSHSTLGWPHSEATEHVSAVNTHRICHQPLLLCLLAAAAASNFGSPGTLPFPRQAPAGSRGGLGTEPSLQTCLALQVQADAAVLPTSATGNRRMCMAAPSALSRTGCGMVAGAAPRVGLSQAAGKRQGSPHTPTPGTLARAPGCSCLSVPASSDLLSPWQQGLEPAVASSCQALRDRISLSKLAGGSLAKAAIPGWLPLQAAGWGSWARARAEPRAGRSGQEPAGRWWQQPLPPRRDGFLCQQQMPPHSPSASASPAAWPQSLRKLQTGELSSSQHQDNPQDTGTGWAGLEVRAKTATGTGWSGICLSKGNTPLLWEPSQASDFPISFTTRPVQFLSCKETLYSVVPLQR